MLAEISRATTTNSTPAPPPPPSPTRGGGGRPPLSLAMIQSQRRRAPRKSAQWESKQKLRVTGIGINDIDKNQAARVGRARAADRQQQWHRVGASHPRGLRLRARARD